MLCCGLIHGDLSPYNVLVDAEGPVLIDFPQVVCAAGNNAARQMLLRDVNNLTAYLGRWAPELLDTWYGEEMWALFESGALPADLPLTGALEHDEHVADIDHGPGAVEKQDGTSVVGGRGGRRRLERG